MNESVKLSDLFVVPYNNIVKRTSFMYNVFFKIKTI